MSAAEAPPGTNQSVSPNAASTISDHASSLSTSVQIPRKQYPVVLPKNRVPAGVLAISSGSEPATNRYVRGRSTEQSGSGLSILAAPQRNIANLAPNVNYHSIPRTERVQSQTGIRPQDQSTSSTCRVNGNTGTVSSIDRVQPLKRARPKDQGTTSNQMRSRTSAAAQVERVPPSKRLRPTELPTPDQLQDHQYCARPQIQQAEPVQQPFKAYNLPESDGLEDIGESEDDDPMENGGRPSGFGKEADEVAHLFFNQRSGVVRDAEKHRLQLRRQRRRARKNPLQQERYLAEMLEKNFGRKIPEGQVNMRMIQQNENNRNKKESLARAQIFIQAAARVVKRHVPPPETVQAEILTVEEMYKFTVSSQCRIGAHIDPEILKTVFSPSSACNFKHLKRHIFQEVLNCAVQKKFAAEHLFPKPENDKDFKLIFAKEDGRLIKIRVSNPTKMDELRDSVRLLLRNFECCPNLITWKSVSYKSKICGMCTNEPIRATLQLPEPLQYDRLSFLEAVPEAKKPTHRQIEDLVKKGLGDCFVKLVETITWRNIPKIKVGYFSKMYASASDVDLKLCLYLRRILREMQRRCEEVARRYHTVEELQAAMDIFRQNNPEEEDDMIGPYVGECEKYCSQKRLTDEKIVFVNEL